MAWNTHSAYMSSTLAMFSKYLAASELAIGAHLWVRNKRSDKHFEQNKTCLTASQQSFILYFVLLHEVVNLPDSLLQGAAAEVAGEVGGVQQSQHEDEEEPATNDQQ